MQAVNDALLTYSQWFTGEPSFQTAEPWILVWSEILRTHRKLLNSSYTLTVNVWSLTFWVGSGFWSVGIGGQDGRSDWAV